MLRPKQFSWAAMLAVTYFTVNYLLLALCGDFLYSYLPGLCGAFFVGDSSVVFQSPIDSASPPSFLGS